MIRHPSMHPPLIPAPSLDSANATSAAAEVVTLSRLIDQIDAYLPQTQCTQCGYHGCRPYAEAIAHNQADINQCPPGAEATITALAHLLNRPILPLNPAHGQPQRHKWLAVIDEAACIGCTLCIQACPLDAIVGAARLMHTVIAEDCTGCGLCLPPCPVDCIRMTTVAGRSQAMSAADAQRARQRVQRRQARLAAQAPESPISQAQTAIMPLDATQTEASSNAMAALKQRALAAALAKARAR